MSEEEYNELCRRARNLYQKENYHKNKDKVSEYQRKYRENNKDKVNEYNRKYWLKKAKEMGLMGSE